MRDEVPPATNVGGPEAGLAQTIGVIVITLTAQQALEEAHSGMWHSCKPLASPIHSVLSQYCSNTFDHLV